LLDWLAVEFMENGWSLKWLHRLIVTSATYQQSSAINSEFRIQNSELPSLNPEPRTLNPSAVDPANRLLWHAPRFRMEAEAVRDIALSASGLLNEKLGGPPVYPPAPEFLFVPPASYGPKVWKEDKGDGRYRRALYTFRFRSVPYPVLTNFDAPNGEFACVRRARSNTPLQALTTLNEPLFLDCARSLALKALHAAGPNDWDRMTYAFRCCTGRLPETKEAAVLLVLLGKELERFSRDNAQAIELSREDQTQSQSSTQGISTQQLAAWTAVSRVLLNLDETITRE
jgi:hypothetical protein